MAGFSRVTVPAGTIASSMRFIALASYKGAEAQTNRDGSQKLVDGKAVYPLRGLAVKVLQADGTWQVVNDISVKARVAKDWPQLTELVPVGNAILTPYVKTSGNGYSSVAWSIVVDDLDVAK